VGKIFGSGSYKMSQNSLWSTTDQCPVMHSNSETVTLRHREYIQDINSSVAFVNTEFSINPGLSGTFPFLATIAANFQEYSFRGLVFEFKSTSADALNSTNTALGTVAMAVQYRAGASSFTTKQQVLNEMWSADAKPANSFFMPVECAPAECPMDIQYVRTGALGSNDDIKFYDLGRLSVATVGSQAAAVVGELWASYEVVLRKPILVGAIGADVESAQFYRSGINASSQPVGDTTQSSGGNSLGITFPDTNTIRIPAGSSGKYLLTMQWTGGLGVWVAPSMSRSNISVNTQNGLSIVTAGSAPTGGLGVSLTAEIYLTDPSTYGQVSFSGYAFITPVYLYVSVSQIDFDTVST